MTTEEANIANAWRIAADDLGIAVVIPYSIRTDEGDVYPFIAWIKDFGGVQGTLICLPDQWDDLGFGDAAEAAGYYCSGLYPKSYSAYEREHFIDTLRDWGWFGDREVEPAWYPIAASPRATH